MIRKQEKIYIDRARKAVEEAGESENFHVTDFIKDMVGASAATDLIISVASADPFSELPAGQPVIPGTLA